jgi:hypothetical protein
MNHTRLINHPVIQMLGGGGLLVLLAALVSMGGGCADPRTEPLRTPTPGYTETKVLWTNVPSNGNVVEANFTVNQELAPISDPENDVPARLTLVAYIMPDTDVLHREHIISSEIPPLRDLIIAYLVDLDQRTRLLDSLVRMDSLCSANPDSCSHLGIDSTTYDTQITQLRADTAAYNDSLAMTIADTTALGALRDSLGVVADNRYTLTLWMDSDTTQTYPEAVFTTPDHQVGQQEIYLASTDTTTGYKGRRFTINMNSFEAADPNRVGRTEEVNWTTCFLGSSRPCLSTGAHTLRARVTGEDTQVTATLVLVYAEGNP